MADISLTASMRSNLLSLQSTQSLMDKTQERLSTGKKVNSAIDNPSSYYTAQSLSNRGNDLNALLDSMGQGIQTIKAADEAIKTITSFAEQAKATANAARDVPSNFDKFAISSKEITAPVVGDFWVDARTDLSTFELSVAAADNAKTFSVYTADGVKKDITLTGANAAAIEANAITQLQGLGLNAKGDGAGKITVSSTDGSAVSWVNPAANGLATSTTAAKPVTLSAVTGANAATIAATIDTAGTALGIDAAADGKTVSITAKNKELRILGATTPAISEAGIEGSRKAGDAYAVNTQRTSSAAQFNKILEQIDQLASDAGYKGVNLLQENDLKVIFNENRSSMIQISGVDASSKGLGIAESQNDWQKDVNIDMAIAGIEGAITKLRTYASDFGNNYSVVQSREDFTGSLISVLTEGSDKLTLADMNEESANMLALQTRQQLAINSLSLASQAAQSVLKLFG